MKRYLVLKIGPFCGYWGFVTHASLCNTVLQKQWKSWQIKGWTIKKYENSDFFHNFNIFVQDNVDIAILLNMFWCWQSGQTRRKIYRPGENKSHDPARAFVHVFIYSLNLPQDEKDLLHEVFKTILIFLPALKRPHF